MPDAASHPPRSDLPRDPTLPKVHRDALYRTARCVPSERQRMPGSLVYTGPALVRDVVIGLTCDEDGGW
jgi:hypothetical protein